MEICKNINLKQNVILTFAIATYKVEAYIVELLESIVNNLPAQYHNDVEFIICDDCSTDNTCYVTKKYFEQHAHLQYNIMQNDEHTGTAGTSFNNTLTHSRGKYIQFIDGDDLINGKLYRTFFEQHILEGSDIYDYGFASFINNITQTYFLNTTPHSFIDYYPYNQSYHNFKKEIRAFICTPKIIKKEFLIKNNIWFSPIVSFQDKNLCIKMYKYAPKVSHKKDLLVFYRCGISSVSTGLKHKRIVEHDSLTKELKQIFPRMVQGEKNYIIQSLLNSEIIEASKNVAYCRENEIFSDFSRPNQLYVLPWAFYLMQKAIEHNNINLVKKMIQHQNDWKYIVNNQDYKVIRYLSPFELEKFMLFVLLRSLSPLEKNYISDFDDFYKRVMEELNLREVFVQLSSDVVKKKYFTYLKNIILHMKMKEFKFLLHNGRYPLFIKTKEALIEYFYTYIKKYEVRYTTIIVSYNRKEYIETTIESFLRNNYAASELIIVDNGSNKSTIKCIENKIRGYENIKLVKLSKNKYGGARNDGITIAQGAYISFLDDDDELVDNYYEILDKYLADQTTDILRFNMVWVDAMNRPIPRLYYANIYSYSEDSNIAQKEITYYNELRTAISSSCLSIIHSRLLNSKSFVEYIVHEDTLFFNEVTMTSNKINFISEPLYLRKELEGSITASTASMNNSKREFYLSSVFAVYLASRVNAEILKLVNTNTISFYYKLAIKRLGITTLNEELEKRQHYLLESDISSIKRYIEEEETLPDFMKQNLIEKYETYRSYK